jgi:AbrB family looped-hinge helix DNA binding protein
MQDGRSQTVEAVAKVTAKGQTTIPKEVREALGIGPGDLIVWELSSGKKAVVRRAQPWDLEYLRAVEGTLSEWTSPADEEAYRDL